MSRKSSSTGNILFATVYNTDGSVKSDLAFNTAGISIVIKKLGVADSAAMTLSAKAGPSTAHSAGAFLNVENGRITVDVADSHFTGYTGEIWLSGSFTGGVIIGDREQLVGYDPTAGAVGANTTTPPTAAANAAQVRTELATELARIDVAVSSVSGGGGGGDNAEVLEAIDSMKSLIAEWIALNIPSDVRGFPATIIGGTDVVVSLEVVDSNDDPIIEIFGESVETVQWLFGMGTSARRARILGSVEWTSGDLLVITIAKSDTLSEDDGPRTWMIGCQLTGGEVKWVKTGVTRLIGRQFTEPTTTTTGA